MEDRLGSTGFKMEVSSCHLASAINHKQVTNPFSSQQENSIHIQGNTNQDPLSVCSNLDGVVASNQQNSSLSGTVNQTECNPPSNPLRWPANLVDNQPLSTSYSNAPNNGSSVCTSTYHSSEDNSSQFATYGCQSEYNYSNNLYNRNSWQPNNDTTNSQQQQYNYNYYLEGQHHHQQQQQQENVHDRYSYYHQNYSNSDYESQFVYPPNTSSHNGFATSSLESGSGAQSSTDRIFYTNPADFTEIPKQETQTWSQPPTSRPVGTSCELVTSSSQVIASAERNQGQQQQQQITLHLSTAQSRQIKTTADNKGITGGGLNGVQRTNQCSVCGRNYARPSTLKTHLRTHTNERPFKCNVCLKTFSQAANLTAHQRVHTGERPFSCPICGRQFSQSSSVITHLRTHSGERPYRCGMCSRTFSDSSTLTKHCRIHSGEKPYQCDYCPLNFSQSGNLSRHLKLHLLSSTSSSCSGSSNQITNSICNISTKGSSFLINSGNLKQGGELNKI